MVQTFSKLINLFLIKKMPNIRYLSDNSPLQIRRKLDKIVKFGPD